MRPFSSMIQSSRAGLICLWLIVALLVLPCSLDADEPGSPGLRIRKAAAVAGGGAYEHYGEWAIREERSRRRVLIAVADGIKWLVRTQAPDGSWHGTGNPAHRPALTGLALVALLDGGAVPGDGTPAGLALERGLRHLRSIQQPSGCIGPQTGRTFMFSHAFGTYAFLRAYGATERTWLERVSKRAIAFHGKSHNRFLGWRYDVRGNENDTCMTACMMLGVMEAARINRRLAAKKQEPPFELSSQQSEGVRFWLSRTTSPEGRVGYQEIGGGPARYEGMHDGRFPRRASGAATAMGLTMRLHLGDDCHQPQMAGGLRWIQHGVQPQPGDIDQFFWWWAGFTCQGLDRTHVPAELQMFRWREATCDSLVRMQVGLNGGPDDMGSWNPTGAWGSVGGRVYSTALAVSTLQMLSRRARRHSGSRRARATVEIYKTLRNTRTSTEDAVAILEKLDRTTDKRIIGLLSLRLSHKDPFYRFAAAETLARMGAEASNTRSRIARRIGREKHAVIRQALSFALLCIGTPGKGVEEALAEATKDANPGVRYLARQALASLGDDAAALDARQLARFPHAEAALYDATLRGAHEPSARTKRAFVVRERVLAAAGLPLRCADRIGLRQDILPLSTLRLERPLRQIEDWLAALHDPETRCEKLLLLLDEIHTDLGRDPKDRDARAWSCALDMVLGAWARAPRTDARQKAEVRKALAVLPGRFASHAAALQALAPKPSEHGVTSADLTADLLRVACYRWHALVIPCDPAFIGRVAREHVSVFGRIPRATASGGWIRLGLAELEEALSERGRDAGALENAAESAGSLATPTGQDEKVPRRVRLRAGAIQAATFPYGMAWSSDTKLPESEPLAMVPPTKHSHGIGVELIELSRRSVPQGGVLVPQEWLVVRVRTTSTQDRIKWARGGEESLGRWVCRVTCQLPDGAVLEPVEGLIDTGIVPRAPGDTMDVPTNEPVISRYVYPIPEIPPENLTVIVDVRPDLPGIRAEHEIHRPFAWKRIPKIRLWYFAARAPLAALEKLVDRNRPRPEDLDLLAQLSHTHRRGGSTPDAERLSDLRRHLAKRLGLPPEAGRLRPTTRQD